MQDAFAQLLSYSLGIWRHRWLALGLAWMLAIGGWVFVAQMKESYVASARVFVDTNSVLRPLMQGLTVNPNINERIAMMSRTLLSRPNLEKLARMTDLDIQATTEAQKENLIRRLENSISLSGTRGNTSLYVISVTDPDRETSRRIAQALIRVFIETSMSDHHSDSSGAQTFFEHQLGESEKRLIEAENRLAAFKQAHVDVLPSESGDYFSRLQSARSSLEQARLQLREMENRRAELVRQLEGEDPLVVADGSLEALHTPFDARIQSLQVQLDRLLTNYTEMHPEVRRIQGLIRDLEAEREIAFEQMRSNPGSGFSTMSSSPIYQGMRSMLAETQAQAAELRVRVAEFEARVNNLHAKLNQIPEVEAQLKQLDRDYNVIARQHQQMLERRESARLAGDVQNSAGDVTFRVVDPPFVPREPSHPNKPVLKAGVLVASLGGGGALALLISLLYPIVTDARMLAQSTGLPLLGTVTYHKTTTEARSGRWQLVIFAFLTLGLLMAFAGFLIMPGLIA
jgi:polysaccharide chain length determinant protein (PEP-CTERM system associated)